MKMQAIGGDRIGAGGKVEVERQHFERSTHDKSFIIRTTAPSGVVIPFQQEILLPDDQSEIKYNAEVLTLPTNGPLFGSFIFDIHVFTAAIRLYQGDLQGDLLEIGNDMSLVKLPQIRLRAKRYTAAEIQAGAMQIEPSSLMAHLDVMGLARSSSGTGLMTRDITALGVLTYYDIIKCYYANKQEANAYIIHTPVPNVVKTIQTIVIKRPDGGETGLATWPSTSTIVLANDSTDTLLANYTGTAPQANDIIIRTAAGQWIPANEMFVSFNVNTPTVVTWTTLKYPYWGQEIIAWAYADAINPVASTPTLTPFLLKNIDTMRINLLKASGSGTAYTITNTTGLAPYSTILEGNTADGRTSLQYPLEGLAVKTYQSDLFNNWVQTEWINSVSSRSAVNTAGGSFTMDTLNMAKKVYEHLSALAMAGGTYDDWLEVAYSTEQINRSNNPVYQGGLRKEIAFQEVVSNAAAEINGVKQPLGQLAGRGAMTKMHKGGHVQFQTKEPSLLLATFSITPRIDYSQGNTWIANLKTIDDLHKPIFDRIGFQDLITDQLAWFDTAANSTSVLTFKSAGKVPAWINYMTNVNKTRGNFAITDNQMFMTLNRRYEMGSLGIKDLTTYIDPAKYNYIFAEADLSAQNFWVHIGVDYKIRRKMSAKLMPNF